MMQVAPFLSLQFNWLVQIQAGYGTVRRAFDEEKVTIQNVEIAEETLDVLIIAAGVSGIGAAYYLQKELPLESFASWRPAAPWEGPEISSAIGYPLRFGSLPPRLRIQAVEERQGDRGRAVHFELSAGHGPANIGVDRKIRYHLKVLNAAWSSERARWTVGIERADSGGRKIILCRWIFCVSRYYDYQDGFSPRSEGAETFRGTVVHPQK